MTTSRPSAAGHLLRILGIAFGLAVVVGGVVGQGILRAPGLVAGAVPDPTLIMLLWAAGGLLALIDACSLVELGASIPREGGPYALARRAYGPTAGIVVGWADWIQSALAMAFMSVVFAEFCQRLGIGADWPMWTLSLGLLALCVAINWSGTRASGSSQTILSALKGVGLIALIAALFLIPPTHAVPAAAAVAPAVSPPLAIGALMIALSAVYNTYAGWNSSVYFGEEIVAPERNVVRATFGGIGLVMVLYLGVNAGLLHVLSPGEMAGSTLPAADAAMRVFGQRGETIITILSLVSVGAIANLYLLLNSRVGFAMARDGVLPRSFAQTSASGTPRVALLASAVVAGVAAASGTYLQIVAATVALAMAIVASMNLAAIVMRVKEPKLARPFSMPLYPLPSIIGLLINAGLLVGILVTDPWHSAIGLGAAAVLGLGYALVGRREAPAAA